MGLKWCSGQVIIPEVGGFVVIECSFKKKCTHHSLDMADREDVLFPGYKEETDSCENYKPFGRRVK